MIDAVVFDESGVQRHGDAEAALREAKAATGTTWVRVHDGSDREIERVAAAFGVHHLAIEDVQRATRPKTETFDEYTFTLIKDAELRRGEQRFEEEVAEATVGLFFGDDWLVTISQSRIPAVDRVWDAVVADETQRILQRGPDFTAAQIVDRLVDEYFDVLDGIETQVEAIEDAVVDSTDVETLEAINGVRRDLLAFRKIAWPTREALSILARGEPEFVREETEKYFRDIYDHVVQVVDLIQTYRDLASGARDIYLNSLSQSTNEVMKTLTIVATIFIPLTFVVGVYGMNFEVMPELTWPWGYPAVLMGMAGIALLMVLYFRRQEWL